MLEREKRTGIWFNIVIIQHVNVWCRESVFEIGIRMERDEIIMDEPNTHMPQGNHNVYSSRYNKVM